MIMTTPAVSILVPVYNVSNYIERCAHSLFQQTFEDIEYVFVNDCTPDDSIEKLQKVIDQYPNRKEHIKIIHHEKNRGLAAARNTAIDNSTGKYIQHIDSDDWIEPDMVEELYLCAIKENADIAVCDATKEYRDKSIRISDYVSGNKEEDFHNMLIDTITQGYTWNKLINRNLYDIQDCRVPEGLNCQEDRHVTTRLYYYANKIVKVNKALYHYIYNDQSITGGHPTYMRFENLVRFWTLLDSFLVDKGIFDKYKNDMDLSKVKQKMQLMIRTNNLSLCREFSGIFLSEEMRVKSRLSVGERIILFYIRHKQFRLLELHRQLLILKQKILHRKK